MAAKKSNKSENFATIFGLAVQLANHLEAEAILVWVENRLDWESLTKMAGELPVLLAADEEEDVEGAAEHGLEVVAISNVSISKPEKLGQAVLQSISDEVLHAGAVVIAVYSAFDNGIIDSVSRVQLNEHLGRLTVRDLRGLGTRVPLDTVRTVVKLAVEIGREGREGKPVGTLFIVGDTRNVLTHCRPGGFDAVKGYSRKERSLHDSRVREGVKELAILDGAFVISPDGTVEAACQMVDVDSDITLSHGLGARHAAAASISKATSAIAISVSESSGTIRIFSDGTVALRIEPLMRAMKWKDEEPLEA